VIILLLLSAASTFALGLVITLCINAGVGGALLGLWGALLLVAAVGVPRDATCAWRSPPPAVPRAQN
jgi:hypothetical protein